MAAARRPKSENRAAEPVAGSLPAEILRALRRLFDHEGSVAGVARLVGFRRQRLARWFSRGIPARELADETGLVQLASVIYAQLARLDRLQPLRDARDRKIAANRAARELLATFGDKRERKRLVETIAAWVKRHDEVAKFRSLAQGGVARFALELGVPRELLRKALAKGRQSVSVKLFVAFRRFEAREAAQAVEDEIARRKMDELMELASHPATFTRMVRRVRRRKINGQVVRKTVMVPVEEHEAVIAKVANGDFEFGGSGTFGHRWSRHIGQYLLPRLHPSGVDGWAVVERFVAFARGVPGLSPPQRYPEWVTWVLASELGDEETGSKPEYRDLDHEDSRRFVVNEAYSGGNMRGVRARERTIAKMIERVGVGLDSTNAIYLHGGIAWNYRKRTEDERERREKRYREDRDFQQTLEEIQARVEKAAAEKKAKRARVARRKKVLAGVMSRRSERKRK